VDVGINDGNNQTVAPGSTLPTAPSVIVKDSGGGAVAGVTVTFSVAVGNGTITGAVVTTGADGIARVGSWTLPAAPGIYALTASLLGAGGSPVTFNATAPVALTLDQSNDRETGTSYGCAGVGSTTDVYTGGTAFGCTGGVVAYDRNFNTYAPAGSP
jgi:hypothetical protein